ncbi:MULTISPECIES: PepSY domain-containing protein [Thalassotalea]|uniref:PepSY domain-containing protein n=1 Tax=Thalassotalea castellviae TaxID=3075612 RepID=A0ABU3A2Y1_9GAMM|nr:PepSY domain-containing protein [Thalassotalea sp. W431]MDT0604504.1 PepSY domain-containing protein [Thalassotalea sp. W431]
MSSMTKVSKLLMISVLSSVVTTWSFSAMPVAAYHGAYIQGAKSSSLAISSSQQAARIVKSQFGGKILKVQRTKVNGNSGYKVKVLKNNGHVITVTVDAVSGRISGR